MDSERHAPSDPAPAPTQHRDGSPERPVDPLHFLECGNARPTSDPCRSEHEAQQAIALSATKVLNKLPDLPMVIGVSTRALFDVEEEHDVFMREGEEAYSALQRERETDPLKRGCAFEPLQRLLALNPQDGAPCVEVVLLSHNAPDMALRAFHSCAYYGLTIVSGSFTSGRSVAPFLSSWGVDLFLSNDDVEVRAALARGIAAAKLGATSSRAAANDIDDVHFALDGDSVIFDSASDRIFEEQGLEAFETHERANALVAMRPGPFGSVFLQKLVKLRQACLQQDGKSRVRITLVTARNAPAQERAVRTLRAWNALFDEAHFLGCRAKAPFLAAAGAHIFFDDRQTNVEEAEGIVTAGLVPNTPR